MNPEWKERDAERERLVALYQHALATEDNTSIEQTKNQLLLSVLPIVTYQAAKLRPGDEDFAQEAIIYVASKLKYYKGAKNPGTSALGSNIKTWVNQFWTRDTSLYPATVKVSQLRAHRKALKAGQPTDPLPTSDDGEEDPQEPAPSALDMLIEQEEHLERMDLVNSLLSELSPTEAEAIRLLRLEEYTHSQAAKEMKVTVQRLKQIEEQAMRKLKREDD